MVRGLIILGISIWGLSACEAEDPWQATCMLYEAYEDDDSVCDDIAPPKIIYEDMRDGLQGYYDGGDTIYVNEDLKGNDKFATIIHEMVHYLDVMWGGLPIPGPALLVCGSEDKAWFIEGVWWGIQGVPENARPDWWKSYPHCWEFYAPTEGFSLTIQQYIDIMDIGDDPILVVPNEQNP
jgi:hypothetical protein